MLSDGQRRAMIGLMALAAAAAALWLNWFYPALGDDYPQFAAGAVRVVPVLALLWITWPELQKGGFAALLFIVGAVCLAAVLVRGGRTGIKFLVPALGLLFTLAYLRRWTTALVRGGDSQRRR